MNLYQGGPKWKKEERGGGPFVKYITPSSILSSFFFKKLKLYKFMITRPVHYTINSTNFIFSLW